ncbi:MAG: DUF3168 domain-containing protein [Anaerolineae bacterium]|nr:DUF3168 domain-containing protein [Anaerolineae bacterium]
MLLAVAKGVYGELAAGTAITALVSTRIYNSQAPQTAETLPYVVFSLASGGDTNDTPREELDVIVDVKAVAATALEAQQAADAIRATLHDADLTLDGDWAAVRCQHHAAFFYAENVERRQYWHAGGSYRIRAVVE